jgi:hypothetical protein
MKNYVILTILFFCSYACFAQKYPIELEKSYSKKELKTMSDDDLSLLNYALNHAVYTTLLPHKNAEQLKTLKVSPSIVRFTDAALRIENQNQYFIIEGTDKMLVIKSKYVLQNELKNKKN